MRIDWASEKNIKRIKSDWEAVAKEELEVGYSKGNYTAFGSELAILRLWHSWSKHYHPEKVRADYSENLGTWYFNLEV